MSARDGRAPVSRHRLRAEQLRPEAEHRPVHRGHGGRVDLAAHVRLGRRWAAAGAARQHGGRALLIDIGRRLQGPAAEPHPHLGSAAPLGQLPPQQEEVVRRRHGGRRQHARRDQLATALAIDNPDSLILSNA